MNLDGLAEEIVGLILEGKDEERLNWSSDRARVTLLMGNIVPKESGYKQTVAGRRKRLGVAIETKLQVQGWVKVPGTSPRTYAHSFKPRGDRGR